MTLTKQEFIKALQDREKWVLEVFNRPNYRESFRPEQLREAVYSYLLRPAKRLRPGIIFFCCGAVGGREELAKQAAASIEVFHTWTLVHDDIIDNDPKRRGFPTVHEQFRVEASRSGYNETEAVEFGRNVAILTGDLQHAWSVKLLLDSIDLGVSAPVVIDLVKRLESDVNNGLLEGEALDVIYSKRPITELTESDVLTMLELKTGLLYEYAGLAGASIGLNQTAADNGLIGAIGRFARKCGTAFQLQDDILGIVGDEKLLGKEVASDIREGKRTTIVLHAFNNAGTEDQRYLKEWLGNPGLTEQEVMKIRRILIEYNGIEYTRSLAESVVEQAIEEIAPLPESTYKQLLLAWAKFVIDRDF